MIPTSVEVLTPTEDVITPSKTYKIEILDENAQIEATDFKIDNQGILGVSLWNSSDAASSGLIVDNDSVALSYNAKVADLSMSQDSDGNLILEDALAATERLSGYVDGLDAIKQAIYLILNTERYKYIIYSWDYGVELNDLFGKPMPFVISEVERRITEALMQDDRIIGVSDFEFTRNRNKLHVTFNVRTNVGVISSETEVRV